MVMSDSDLELSCDSGIEAEMDDLRESCSPSDKNDKLERNEKKRTRSHPESGSCQDCCKTDLKTQNKRSHKKAKKDDDDEDFPKANCQFLWEFLHHLLISKRYEQCIAWKNANRGIFRMVDHNMVAKLWGKHKKRKNMTYDKLSRALRYYYAKNILAKVNGQRLTYKFCRDPSGKKYPS
ncbi:hypothetical protein QZH41_002464 [Actinostola sp. cb2023]|nr:hypothetical protein QZH41_002464 [Actinostola sp. cb2023]